MAFLSIHIQIAKERERKREIEYRWTEKSRREGGSLYLLLLAHHPPIQQVVQNPLESCIIRSSFRSYRKETTTKTTSMQLEDRTSPSPQKEETQCRERERERKEFRPKVFSETAIKSSSSWSISRTSLLPTHTKTLICWGRILLYQ